MKKIIPVLIILAILAGLICAWFFSQKSQNNHSRISVSGMVEAKEVLISAEVSGQVKKIYFDEGREIHTGETLAEIDREPLLAQAKAAEADWSAASANLAQNQRDFTQAENLYQEKIISYDQYHLASTKLKLAGSQLKQAESKKQLIQTQLNKAIITSPLDGTIAKKLIEQGELASPGLPLFSVIDLNDVWVKVFVPEEQLGLVKLGQEAKVWLDSFPGRVFPGKVIYIAEEAEFTPRNIQTKKERVRLVFAVKIKIDNQKRQFKPGLPADVEIGTADEAG